MLIGEELKRGCTFSNTSKGRSIILSLTDSTGTCENNSITVKHLTSITITSLLYDIVLEPLELLFEDKRMLWTFKIARDPSHISGFKIL